MMEEKIKAWLGSQGYPLEMKVANLFREQGFTIIQSEYYTDPETGDQRETDVSASVDFEVGASLVRLQFVIECKATPARPWILFTGSGGLAQPARVAQTAASTIGTKVLDRLCTTQDVQDLAQFHIHDRGAYGMTQAFTTGRDVTYDAARSVSKAAAAAVVRADEMTSIGYPVCLIVFPLIIVDAELVEAYLGDDGEIEVSRVGSGTLVWRNRQVGMPHTIIRLLKLTEVEKFAAEMMGSCHSFFELARGTLEEVDRRMSEGPDLTGLKGG